MALSTGRWSLADRTLLERAAVTGPLHATRLSLNHDSLLISDQSGHGWVRKQSSALDHGLSNERAVLVALRSRREPELTWFLPELVDEDASLEGLTLALVPAALTLRAAAARSPAQMRLAMDRLGHALALLHTLDPGDFDLPVRTELHPVLSGHSAADVAWLTPASAGCRQLAALLQGQAALQAQLRTLAPTSEATVTHNDLKWDNILVHPRAGETVLTEITLIDWEMAGIGDPCWDVGTVLSEFLAFWTLSIPIVDDEPDAYMHLAKYPLEDMQPAIQAFWCGYVEVMGFEPAEADVRLIRSTRLAGARLIQTAYERTQTMSRLTPQIYLLLQLSLNIMEGPEEAAEHLLGIPHWDVHMPATH